MGSRVLRNGNPDRVLKSQEPCQNLCSKRFGIGSSFLGIRSRFSFLGARNPIATCLKMKEKICLNIAACSKTRRKELSSGFSFLGIRNSVWVSRKGTQNWHRYLAGLHTMVYLNSIWILNKKTNSISHWNAGIAGLSNFMIVYTTIYPLFIQAAGFAGSSNYNVIRKTWKTRKTRSPY
jgi:hypothetical protein